MLQSSDMRNGNQQPDRQTDHQPENQHLPEVIVFAGPNGSGKSTIAKMARIEKPYINADDIKRATNCTDLEAAELAEDMRETALAMKKNFTFETVLSTERNLNLLKRAKESGYFVRCIYVLTANPSINVLRVESRAASGGHYVPEDKIRGRYDKALALVPELVKVADVMHIYDNTNLPFRIFKKRKTEMFYWKNQFWSLEQIEKLTGTQAEES